MYKSSLAKNKMHAGCLNGYTEEAVFRAEDIRIRRPSICAAELAFRRTSHPLPARRTLEKSKSNKILG